MITVIGLGVEKGDVSKRAEETIVNGAKAGRKIVVRTKGTNSYQSVLALGVEHTTLDGIYETSRSFNTLAKNLAKAVVDAVRAGGEYTLENDAEVSLKEEDLQIFTESKSGFISASDKGVTVALNTSLTEELILEGIERELVSKVQAMRKEADFQITDRISIYYIAEGKAKEVLSNATFKEDVLAISVEEGNIATADITKEVDINGEKVSLSLVKMSK